VMLLPNHPKWRGMRPVLEPRVAAVEVRVGNPFVVPASERERVRLRLRRSGECRQPTEGCAGSRRPKPAAARFPWLHIGVYLED
jgi:hypothetical protein